MKNIKKILNSMSLMFMMLILGFGSSVAYAAEYTMEEVAQHNTESNCWVVVDDNVYNATNFIELHPGGADAIIDECGGDATVAFNNGPHSAENINALNPYLIGTLVTTIPVLTTLTVTPETASLVVGGTQGLTAITRDQDGDLTTSTLTFDSSNTTVATVNSVGIVTGLSIGTSIITTTAVKGNVTLTDTSTITVTTTTPPPTNNRAPNISGITAPTVLDMGEMGTWKIKASDPENGSLSYAVDWGETNSSMKSLSKSFVQTTTFTHTYDNPGHYTITFTVIDDVGKSNTSTVDVHVNGEINNDTAPVITSLTGPTTVEVGETETITIKAYDPNNSVLSYSAVWGDENTLMRLQKVDNPFVQTSTFSHVYNTTGSYTAVFSVMNENGEETSSSININVTALNTTMISDDDDNDDNANLKNNDDNNEEDVEKNEYKEYNENTEDDDEYEDEDVEDNEYNENEDNNRNSKEDVKYSNEDKKEDSEGRQSRRFMTRWQSFDQRFR